MNLNSMAPAGAGKGRLPLFSGPALTRLIMRVSVLNLFFLLSIQLLYGIDGSGQSLEKTRVNMGMNNEPLEKLFDKLKAQTQFTIGYTNSEIQEYTITFAEAERSVKEVLDIALADKPLTYTLIGNAIIINRKKKKSNDNIQPSFHDQGRAEMNDGADRFDMVVSGVVTDIITGQLLPGVSVMLKETTMGTVTDNVGSFTISVPNENSVLVFSFIGYAREEVPVNGRSVINVALTEDVQGLQEVVVVGYGTQKRRDLSGAVASVKGEDMQKTPATNLVQSLQGRAPGVDVKAASNAPGGGIRIRIRGSNSINASSEPLYVIDGFPLDNINTAPEGAGNNAQPADPLSSISPSEIESIEILKDASATAIYGARGANGVVLITTKRGQKGNARIDFDYSVNVAVVRKKLDLVNAEELATLTNEWAANNNRPPVYDGINKPLPAELGEGTDWQDQIFRTALTHSYNLSVSAGNDNTKYLLSGNYLDQDGIIIESNFKRGGLKFNLDQKISERIKAGVNLNVNRSVNDAVPSDGSGYQNDTPLWNALATTPAIPVYDEEGNYVNNHDEGLEKILENPVSIAKTRTDITHTTRVLSSAFTEIDLLKKLTFRANFGTDIIYSKRNIYIPNTAETQALPNLGIASIGTVQSFNWLQEYTVTYNGELGIHHRLTALAGFTSQTRETESAFSRTDNFFTNKVEYNNLGAGADPRPSSSNAVKTALLSYIGRVNYVYRDKYIITGTVRRDGSSKFGTDNKWGIFPSAAFAWRLGDENFMQGFTFIEDLKLRTSYGLTGNESISPYSSQALYTTTTQIIGGVPVIGLIPNRIPNPNLKWERTAQFNAGIDLEVLNGKLSFSAEYYVKRTKDLLLNVTIPAQSGYSTSVQNIGEVENRGFEFQLGLKNMIGPVEWRSSFNISLNRNKVISLAKGTERLLFTIGNGESAYGSSIVKPGEPLGMFYGYHFQGIWQTEEEIIEAGNTVGGVNRPGLPRYADLSGDGFKQNDSDRQIIGNPNPDFIFGFSNNFSYKNFSLNIFMNGTYGNEIADLNRIGLLTQPQKHNVLQEYYDERWIGPGTSNSVEGPITNAGEWKNFSDRDVLDGSFLRVKTINLSYTLAPGSLGLKKLRSAQIYVAGDNLITITSYTGFDPEVDLYASSNVQLGVDNGAYPVAKSIRIGIKVGL